MFAWVLIPLFERIDASLEKYGDFDSLQKFRLTVVNYYMKHDPRLNNFNLGKLLQGIFAFDLTLRYYVQREEYLKQKCHELQLKEMTKGEEKQLKHYLSLLKICSRGYWCDERRLYKLESMLPAGPFRRAYDTHRSNPKWYLHPDLRNDCAGRGGCCGRQCGCCEKREPTPQRPRGVGHCTVECGCCATARGFEIQPSRTDKTWLEVMNGLVYEWDIANNKAFYNRYMQAFFIGIQSERDQAPRWI